MLGEIKHEHNFDGRYVVRTNVEGVVRGMVVLVGCWCKAVWEAAVDYEREAPRSGLGAFGRSFPIKMSTFTIQSRI